MKAQRDNGTDCYTAAPEENAAVAMVYKFGDFRLDCGRYELVRGDRRIKLERKPMDLLVLFTSRQGELITRSEIAERLWTEDVFVDTEHGINTAVRKLRLHLRDDADEPKYIETVTGRGYRFVAPVTAEPAVAESAPEPAPKPEVPAAPAVEIPETAAGEVLETLAPAESAGANRHWVTRAWWAAAVAIACGLIVFVATRQHLPPASPVVKAVAVLPLENLSGDTGQEYLADGMTDELTTMLARNSTLAIRSRTSVMRYKGTRESLPDIARALNVDAIVEGSVARSDGRVHLNLQLIRAADDSHLWAQSYDQDGRDTLLPEKAAEEIAGVLHASPPVLAKPHKVDPAAHDAYLRGKFLWFTENMQESGSWFRKATEIQPDYAAAWAGLADYYGEGVAAGVLDPRTSLGPMEEAATRAVQLDPGLSEAHQAMAATYLIAKWDGAAAEDEMQQALRLDAGSAEAWYLQACVLLYQRRNEEAVAAAKKSEELAPMQRPGAAAGIMGVTGDYDAALDDLQLQLRGTPNNAMLLDQTADIWRYKKNYAQYADFLEQWFVAVKSPDTAAKLKRAWQQGGMHAFMLVNLRNSEDWQKSGHYVSPVYLATLHALLGEKERTLDLLEEGYRQHTSNLFWVENDPAFDLVRNDARFRAVVDHLGRPAAH